MFRWHCLYLLIAMASSFHLNLRDPGFGKIKAAPSWHNTLMCSVRRGRSSKPPEMEKKLAVMDPSNDSTWVDACTRDLREALGKPWEALMGAAKLRGADLRPAKKKDIEKLVELNASFRCVSDLVPVMHACFTSR
jgi:hypothetical protein